MHTNKKVKFGGACLLALVAGGPPAWSQGSPPTPQWNMYNGATHGLEIAYTAGALNHKINDETFGNNAAKLHIKVAGSLSIPVTVDTGSTGIAIAANYLPAGALTNLKSLGPGAINYDSSGNSPTGNFYELPISILGGKVNGADKVGTTTVKVLVVTSDTTTAYFGIGDNRNNVYSGTYNPSLTSDPSLNFKANVAQGNITQISAVGMNPLINVAVDGVALKHQGYVVQNGQIVVGLTTANNTFSFVKLTPDAANGPNLWNGIPVALSGAGGPYGTGTILHDTGIAYAFLNPNVDVNQTVAVSLPGMPNLVEGGMYSFVKLSGEAPQPNTPCFSTTALTPCAVAGSPSGTPFLNTGRQFFSGFDYLFDPVNGYAGYALSGSGLTTEATLSPLLALIGNVSLQSDFATNLPTFLMGATTLLQTGTGTISSVISGSGGLTIGSGRVDLRGVNTYTGGTTVTGGATLGIGADSRLGDASGGLTLAGGTLLATAAFTSSRAMTMGTGGGTFNTNGFDVVLGTPVSGVGSLTKDGTGVLTLSGANSYTGGTVVNAGTLRLATGASLSPIGALVVNGGLFDFNGNNVTVGLLSGLGGTISLGTGTLTVTESSNTTLGAIITGTGGLTMSGTGTLNLTAANTYTGPTNVLNGRLAVNGSITSDVTVGSGGNLGGTGRITGTVTNSGAMAPGNSIGTLNVVGSFTQNPGSTYQVETNTSGQSDLINVTGAPGTATINGGTVQALPEAGVYAPSTTYTILTATGGVTGTYNGVTSNLPFLQASLGYDTNNVYLTLKPGGFGAGAATSNQAAVGGVLDRSVAGSSGDFATVIGTMATLTLAQGQAAMDAISGQNYSGFATANLGSSLGFMNVLGQQMSLARGGSGSGTRQALALACDASADGACDDAPASPWTLWGSALGVIGSVAGTGGSAALTYNGGGTATGVDYRFNPNLLVGLGLGFVTGNQYLGGFSGRGTSDSYQGSLYASFTQSAFYLDAVAGFGFSNNNMQRQIFIPGLQQRTAMGQTTANQFVGQAEAGYAIGLHAPSLARVTPFARLQGVSNTQAGFSETGASSLNLTVAQQTTNSLRSTFGADLAGSFDLGWRDRLALQFRLGWVHEYADTSRPVTASFAGAPGAAFTVFGATPQRDAAVIGLAASTAIAASTSLYLRYDGEVGTGTDNHALTAGFRMSW